VKLAREELEKQFLFYDGQSVLAKRGAELRRAQDEARRSEGLGPGETFVLEGGALDATVLAPLPIFVVRFFERRHGVRKMVQRACVELLLTLEDVLARNEHAVELEKVKQAKAAAKMAAQARGADDDDSTASGQPEAVLEAALFASYLREMYTDDQFVFFLHARRLTQALFGLSLAALKTRILSSRAAGILAATGASKQPPSAFHDPMAAPGKANRARLQPVGSGGLLRRQGDVMLRPHPNSPHDGTLQPCLSRSALASVARQLALQGLPGSAGEPGRDRAAQRLAEYMVGELIARSGSVGRFLRLPTAEPAEDGAAPRRGPLVDALPVQNWLQILVDTLRSAPEELVTQGREGKDTDSGGKMMMIEKMQETMLDDEKVVELTELIAEAKRELSTVSLNLLTDQRRFETVSTHLERAGRGVGGDGPEAVLALATEQGQLRTRLLMNKADEARRRALVKELQKQVKATEARRESIWAGIMTSTVMGGEGAGAAAAMRKKRSRVELQSDKLAAALTVKSAASVRCFALWVERLTTRHEVAKEKVSYLATSWKDDLEAFRSRTIVHIQRAFRKRRADRQARAEAQAELAAVRAEAAAAEALAEAERAKVRAGEAAEAERQGARARAVKRQRYTQAVAAEGRAALTRRGAADFEVERRFRRALLRQLRNVFKCWELEVAIARCALGTVNGALRRVLCAWRGAAAELRRIGLAARRIQSIWRGRRERREVAALRVLVDAKNGQAARLLRRIVHRMAFQVLGEWRRLAHQGAHGKRLANRIFGRGRRELLRRWRRFVDICRLERHWAVTRITALVRGRHGRRAALRVAKRHYAAIKLQSWLRALVHALAVARVQARLREMDGKVQLMLGNHGLVYVRLCFSAWHSSCIVEKRAMAMGRRFHRRLLAACISGWLGVIEAQKQARAQAAADRLDAAVLIQSSWRGMQGRRRWYLATAMFTGALLIQRAWRGRLGRLVAWEVRHRIYCVVLVQAAFRGFVARRSLVGRRVGDVLRSAEEGLYDRLKWYFDTFGPAIAHETDEDGSNALHRAAFGAARRTVKLCLSHGMDPNLYNGKGLTPLHLVLTTPKAARDEVAAYLMDHGSYIESPDFDGNTPLLLAAKLGRAAICGQLMDRDANASVRDFKGATPLQVAAIHDHVGAVRSLLDHGILPDEAGADGVTPLHESVGRVNRDIAVALLEAGALPDVQDDEGFTPLMYAASSDEPDMITCLLEWGASVDCRDGDGRTALHIAAERSALDVIKTLLEGDSDLMAADVDGDTALHLAVRAAARRDGEAVAIGLEAVGHVKAFSEADGAARKLEAALEVECREVVARADERRALLAAKNNRGTRYGVRTKAPPPVALAEALAGRELAAQALVELAGVPERLAEVSARADAAFARRDKAEALRGASDDAAAEAQAAREAAARAVACVERLLEYGAVVTAQNEDGDQPAHLAARLGHLPTMALLVKYEAPVGRRNWAELTPVGVARMHGQVRVVQYLLDTLAPEALGIAEPVDEKDDDGVEGHKLPEEWDKPITDQTSDWEEAWDDENQVTYFVNRKTGEMSGTAPKATAELVAKLREFREERAFKAKVSMAVGEAVVGTSEYRAYVAKEKAEAGRLKAMRKAATCVQRNWRRRMARKKVARMREQRNAARKIQRLFRQRMARRDAARFEAERLASGAIQRAWRGYASRAFYANFLYERLWWNRHMRYFALLVQRLWAGHVFRRQVRKLKVQNTLGKKLRYEDWQRLIDDAIAADRNGGGPKAPLRSFRMFDEYRLVGTVDVNFYVHRVTYAGVWDQPQAWVDDDVREREELAEMMRLGYTLAERDAATRFQRMWRARVVRVAFRDVMRGQRLMSGGEVGYMQDPDSPVAVANFALFKHVMVHDYDHARLLYARCLEMMEHRGPDNCFVLFSFAIFLAVTQEDDWDTINLLVERAHACNFRNKRDRRPTRYNLAKAGYFRLATAIDSRNGPAWHNYALCLQLAFKDYPGATEAYIQAVMAAPTDEVIQDNFNYFLDTCRPELVDDGYDAFELVRLHGVKQAEASAAAAAERLENLNAPHCHDAATRIQLHYRSMRLRSMFEGKTAKALAKLPAVEVAEAHTEEERTALVEMGLATWLWERLDTDTDPPRPYWYNNETGETHWDKPTDEWDIIAADPAAWDNDGEGWGEGGLPTDMEEWEVCADADGCRFYYNARTGVSQWEPPASLAAIASLEVADAPDLSTESVVLSVWEECQGDDGRIFFYNVETGESSWDDPRGSAYATQFSAPSQSLQQPGSGDGTPKPAGDADDAAAGQVVVHAAGGGGGGGGGDGEEWEVAQDDDGGWFYYNRNTGESTYERPDGADPVKDAVMDPALGGALPEGVGPLPYGEGEGEGGSHAGGAGLADDWEVVEGDDGTYWYNNATGESSWGRPESPRGD